MALLYLSTKKNATPFTPEAMRTVASLLSSMVPVQVVSPSCPLHGHDLGFWASLVRVFSQHLKHVCHLDIDMECTGNAHLPHWPSPRFPAPPLCLPFCHCLHQHKICRRTQVWLQHRIVSSCIFIKSLVL